MESMWGRAMRTLAPLGAAYLIAAVPGGWLGAKIGRKKSMLIGNTMVCRRISVGRCLHRPSNG